MRRYESEGAFMTISKMLIASILFGAGTLMAGCGPSNNGSTEKAGEKVDNAMDDLTKDHRDITDGPAENLGEKADEAAGNKSASDNN
jgi:hypothetical protein